MCPISKPYQRLYTPWCYKLPTNWAQSVWKCPGAFGRSRVECLELLLQRRHRVEGGESGDAAQQFSRNSWLTSPPPSCSIIHASECEQGSESVQGTLICLLEHAGGRSRWLRSTCVQPGIPLQRQIISCLLEKGGTNLSAQYYLFMQDCFFKDNKLGLGLMTKK